MQIELCFHVVCRRIHSSSAKSRAELRCSGSHCSIFRMKRRKDALSSLLSSVARRVVSRSSSGLEPGRGMPTENSPCGRGKLVGGKDNKHSTSADLREKKNYIAHLGRKRTYLSVWLEQGDWAAEVRGEQSSQLDEPVHDTCSPVGPGQ